MCRVVDYTQVSRSNTSGASDQPVEVVADSHSSIVPAPCPPHRSPLCIPTRSQSRCPTERILNRPLEPVVVMAEDTLRVPYGIVPLRARRARRAVIHPNHDRGEGGAHTSLFSLRMMEVQKERERNVRFGRDDALHAHERGGDNR